MEHDEKLKPCPFCGSTAKLFGSETIYKSFSIVCQNGECLCNARILYCDSEEDAIIQWNRRS